MLTLLRNKIYDAQHTAAWRRVVRFTESPIYYIIVAVFACISNMFGLDLMGLVVGCVMTSFALIVNVNQYPAYFSAILMLPSISRFNLPKHVFVDQTAYYSRPEILGTIIAFGAITLLSFIFTLVVYGKYRKMLRRHQLSLSVIVYAVALISGGLLATGFSPMGLALAASFLLPYFIMMSQPKSAVGGGDSAVRKLCWFMMVLGLVTAVELIYFEATDEKFIQALMSGDYSAAKGLIYLGWTGSNTTGTTLMMTFPFIMYLAKTSKMPVIYLLIALIVTFACALTFSRAAVIVLAGLFVVITVYVAIKGKNKVATRGFLIVAVFIVSFALYAFRNELAELFGFFLETDLNDRGRFMLYNLAIDRFKIAPYFGEGFGYLPSQGFPYYSFHNTFCTILATTGIVGLLAYLYHRIDTLILIFKNFNEPRLFLFGGIFGLLANGMLDICMSNGFHLIYYGMMIATIELDVENNEDKFLKKRPRDYSFPYFKYLFNDLHLTEPIPPLSTHG